MSWIFLDEEFGVRKILGGLLALIGLIWMQYVNNRRLQVTRSPRLVDV